MIVNLIDGNALASRARSGTPRLCRYSQGLLDRCARALLLLVVILGAFALERDAAAGDEAHPTLYVHGQIRGREMRISAEMMGEGGAVTMQTRTPFTDGEPVFTGIAFARLWEMIEPTGRSIRAVAANDYAVEASAEDLIEMEAFIAFAQDGSPLKLRDKGPFWIVFPWSQRPDLYASGIYSLSVWQLVEMEVQ